jgi:hypothetical protein
MILSRILQFLIWAAATCVLAWALTDPGFRGTDGFFAGEVCLPLSIGVALVFIGFGVAGRFRRFAFWLALALVGQAVALQMIEAGNHLRYQHYQTSLRQLAENNPILLIFLSIQTVLVATGIKSRWSTIRAWLHHNFRFWQLLGIGFVFCVFSATVSEKISKYAVELLLASFVQTVNLGNIILLVWAFPEDALDSLSKKFEKIFQKHHKECGPDNAIRIDRFVILAAIWVMIVAATLNYFAYERHPHIPDEVTDYTRAKYFAEGILTSQPPQVPEAFEIYLMQVDGDRYYPVAPIGWPAVLSLGILLGAPWLVNPVLAGLNLILIYLLLQALFSRYVARVSVLLLCASPWYVFMGMSFMTHMSSLIFALCAALALEKARRSGKAMWAWLGGSSIGLMSLVRPLEGLIVAILLGLWSIGLGGKKLKIAAIAGLVGGTIITGSVVLFYNNYLTDDPMTFPLNAYLDKEFGPNANALGFGPDRGMGWALDPYPGHSPIDALVNTSLNTFSINVELLGWSTGSLFLAALFMFSGRLKRSDYLMIALVLGVYIPHFFYYFSGGPDFGARYWFLMIIPFIALTARGTETLQAKLGSATSNASLAGARVKIGVLSLCLFSIVNYFPWRATDKYRHFRGMRPDIRELAAEHGFGKSLVLIRGDADDYPSAWFYNPVDLRADGDVPIYAWDRNQDVRTQVLEAYPDRPVWIINGPSITGGAYEIVSGPIPPGSDLSSDT